MLVRKGEHPEIREAKSFFEPWRTAPASRTGTAQVTTLASFIALTNRHKDADSAIFALTAWPDPKLTAVIDYHKGDATIPPARDADKPDAPGVTHSPRFCKHRIVYAFPLTDEFKAWVAGNGKAMTQADFASFLEDHVADLASPDDGERSDYERLFKTTFASPSEIVDLSRGLQIHVASKVKNAVLLQSGEVDMTFQEEHQNGRGEKITVPGVFMVSVPAFIDGTPVRLPARLRYRVREGNVVWSYQL